MAPRKKAATGEGDKPDAAAAPARRSVRDKPAAKPKTEPAPAKEKKEKKEAPVKKSPAKKAAPATKAVAKKDTKATAAKSKTKKAESKKPAPAKPVGVTKKKAPAKKPRTVAEPKEEKETKKKAPAAKKETTVKKAAAAAKKPTTAAKKTAAAPKKAAAPRKRAEPKKRAAKEEAEDKEEEEEEKQEEAAEAAEAGAAEPMEAEGAEEEQEQEKKPAARKPRAAPKPKAEKAEAAPKRGRKRGADAEAEAEEGKEEEKAEEGGEAGPSEPAAERPAKKARTAAAKKADKAEPEPVFGADQPASDLFVFGTNPFGALGLGEDETIKYRPTQVVVEGTQFVQVVCGGMHTVALSTKGEVWSWGVNDEGALGRVTGGTCWEATPEDEKANAALPGKAVAPEGVHFVQVAAGDGFTLALSTKGAVYGCGTFKDDVSSLSGFTPDSGIEKTLVLLHEPESAKAKVKAIAAGARHCLALTADGKVLTWGIGSQGQLGRVPAFTQENQPDGKVLFKPSPVNLASAGLGRSPVVAIATGTYTSFVITKSGEVAAWGLNGSCQLGLEKAGDEDNFKWEPVKVPAFTKVAAIKGGEHHTLVLTQGGKVLAVGSSTYGSLGRQGVEVGSANAKYPEPAEVEGLGDAQAVALAAGSNVSGCVTGDGNLWLWGSNVNYQLAKGEDEEDNHVPEKFRRPKSFGWRKISALSLGGQHGALLAGPQGEAPAPAAAAAAPAPVPAPEAPAAPAEPAAAPAQEEAAVVAAEPAAEHPAEAAAEEAAAGAGAADPPAPEPEADGEGEAEEEAQEEAPAGGDEPKEGSVPANDTPLA
uniref:RCC1-like domain-containing protein n=1 Tax=Chlamydomonas leiostraca TaxID=1034604 RepID=A0A7S0WHD4_9CHLO|mmetsp:Transcript_13958/g.34392  ORF Transcript_13958/g.34392 Transcript_13958/m.34392 type:complete len:817 (+) Transcript_13958:29-2479(+)|eukprot:CAMPEP_0202864252 /NCGR_PEP_ID=MMETSP1391-20130828/4571_1 /ASSEMBLY_ACC=CAM_ASM_000867 /TAXON_ID=1034604 /ORGANISM="Chlamydomonas leiostraca, Strain SAG 11-49" /LENGTH=816 /DNA_ID=CAMNT_0049543981 /DNA_START=17 /DNA_END=2467 /DNA_ORIENTATION=-